MNDLESFFIEVVNPKKFIMRIIYKHPSVDLTDFNCNCYKKLLQNISKEQKLISLLGSFNVKLFNHYEQNQTNETLDFLASNSFIPLILQRTKITNHSNTLVDNMFSSVIAPNVIPNNLVATISDCMPQLSVTPNMFCNTTSNKSNNYERH